MILKVGIGHGMKANSLVEFMRMQSLKHLAKVHRIREKANDQVRHAPLHTGSAPIVSLKYWPN